MREERGDGREEWLKWKKSWPVNDSMNVTCIIRWLRRVEGVRNLRVHPLTPGGDDYVGNELETAGKFDALWRPKLYKRPCQAMSVTPDGLTFLIHHQTLEARMQVFDLLHIPCLIEFLTHLL
jgi:hypothetical protein